MKISFPEHAYSKCQDGSDVFSVQDQSGDDTYQKDQRKESQQPFPDLAQLKRTMKTTQPTHEIIFDLSASSCLQNRRCLLMNEYLHGCGTVLKGRIVNGK